MQEILRNAPTSPGKVEFAWKTAVGGPMARGASVRLEGTTLLVDAQTPAWASEIRRASRTIVTRMQKLLGEDAIKEVVVRA